MTTVFISGSRQIPFLPEEVRGRIDRMMDAGLDIVVGDSERGVDAKIIEYLAASSYAHVNVYTIHDKPRAPRVLEIWNVCKVNPGIEEKRGSDGRLRNARELETAKDEAMGDVADYGLVVWKSSYRNRFGRESASKGSLRNMYQLVSTGKPVVLYRCNDNAEDEVVFSCTVLRDINDLNAVVESCHEVVRSAYQAMVKGSKGASQAGVTLFDDP